MSYTAEQTEEFEPGPCGACGDPDRHVEWIDVASHDNRDAWIPRVVCACGMSSHVHWSDD